MKDKILEYVFWAVVIALVVWYFSDFSFNSTTYLQKEFQK
jgi:hypothetical protein